MAACRYRCMATSSNKNSVWQTSFSVADGPGVWNILSTTNIAYYIGPTSGAFTLRAHTRVSAGMRAYFKAQCKRSLEF